jgi:nucleoside phosphorylase
VLAALQRAGIRVHHGDLLGAADAAASSARKAELLRASGAVAIDLESHLVAQAAIRAKKPFLVLRAVADNAGRSLPKAAVNGLAADGRPALGRVLLSVMRDPTQIPALLQLARDTRRALVALGSALRVIAF